MVIPSNASQGRQGSSGHHLGPGGSSSSKNVRDNPSNVRNPVPSDNPPCHKACAASSNVNEIQILLALPVLNSFSASQITSLLSQICSLPSCANATLDIAAIPSRNVPTSCCSKATQTSASSPDVSKDVLPAADEFDSHSQGPVPSPNLPISPHSRSPSVSQSIDANDFINDELVFADQSSVPKAVIANATFVDQSIDATESSPYRPALLPGFVPPNAKSYYYWQLSLNRVNVLREFMLGLVESFNTEIDSYFNSLRGPRLKFHDFSKHLFPFPGKPGLKKLHSYLGTLLFQEGYTEDELFPDDFEKVDAVFDNEFDRRLFADLGFDNVKYVPASPCSNCGDDGATAMCTRCKSAVYCNRECQSAHWKAHKVSCVAVANAAQIVPASAGGV